MLVIYGILGFGGQLPIGFLLDKIRNAKPFAIASISFLFASLLTFSFDPSLAIVLTGIAGAGIHVTGGAICLLVSEGKTSVMGMFTAPGVLGLAIGGAVSGIQFWPLLVVIFFLIIFTFLIFKNPFPNYQAYVKSGDQLDRHDWIMLGLLMIMCFRSLIFDLVNLAGDTYPHGALILGLSAFGGKLFGGFLAEKYGWKRTVYCGLMLAFVLLQFGRDNIYCLAFGIACPV